MLEAFRSKTRSNSCGFWGADARQRHAPAGFTLIELLAVISIITLLISITLPSLQHSKEVTRRAICMANSRSQVQACLSYGGSNKDFFPPSCGPLEENWAYSFDIRASLDAAPKRPMGIGLTLAGGYMDIQPAALHCPSLNTTGAPSTPYHSMNVNIGNWWNSVGATWWNDPAYVNSRITIGYTYRAYSWWKTNATDRYIRNGKTPGHFVVNSDILDKRFGMNFAHRDGYNFSRLDGSSTWRSDSNAVFESLAGGSVDGKATPVQDEILFKKFENNN